MVMVTCHTAGCGNADIPIEMVSVVELDGEQIAVDSFSCGVCGQTITDVAE